jgi:inhibitor of KinA sporulation pathway (predicted exonuclease)
MNYIILDLEATCWENNRSLQNEIIEIGAVKVNTNGEVISEFCEFIKPKINQELSEFCKKLTTIKQHQVDSADLFPAVLERFHDWIGKDYFLCSWGFYDKKQFKLDCELHKLEIEWLKNHLSVKHQHSKIKNLKKPLGMGNALKLEGFKLDGTHHRGIDDAKNIAKIFIKYINCWEF